ncbi:peroxiredoxin [Frankia sp. AgPm24]|uniref:peroxiredoxin n=1 Tax=Frankia sp. AgPm24 TaxID=631128 RepID=UPI00200CA812|nr:peroxiredoxin [Frankia sp. AgPm24]MCK9924618.1 peroxiredoxin [Frankia sp. AgPm24]
MATPDVGQPAPEISLPGLVVVDGERHDDQYSLSAQRGHPTVLAFYPGDNTPVCTRQMCSYAAGIEVFRGLGAPVWGISPQDLDSHESFARDQGLGFPLLADTAREAAKKYGIAMVGLGLRRSVFLIDADGVVRWKQVGLVGLTYADVDTIAEQIRQLAPS